MDEDFDTQHERWSWRDIEALPLYILAAICLFLAIGHVADQAGPGVRAMGLKAVLIVGALGYHHLWRADAE